MMTNKLTPKQEKFCQLIFEGKKQNEAYRGAYNCTKHRSTTVNNNAYMLLQNSDIIARIAELRAKLTENTLWDFTKSAKVRIESLQKARQNDDYKAVALLADGLDKLHGITAESGNKSKKEIERIEVVIIDPKN